MSAGTNPTKHHGELISLTNHRGRLVREICESSLRLEADPRKSIVRYNFGFVIDEQPVGIYSIYSIGKKSVSVVRAWNATATTWDPFSKLWMPCLGRQLHKLGGFPPLFLIEYGAELTTVVDRVAFRSKHVRVYDVEMECSNKNLKFEAADLKEIEFLG